MSTRTIAFTLVLGGTALISWIIHANAGLDRDQGPTEESRRAAEEKAATQNTDRVVLSHGQLAAIKLADVREKVFSESKEELGTISFNQDLTVQVFPPYAGRIISVFAETGQDVKKGDVLFTLDSPDLLQAESTVISAAGVAQLTTRNLARAKELLTTHATAEKDVEQATSDQQTAEGNLHTAKNALHVYGKADDEIEQIVKRRSVDSTLVVRSPVAGRITSRNASPGLYIQPGNGTPPYTVANIDTMWMVASVPETDSPLFQVGQPVKVKIDAFPNKWFDGKITMVDAMVDSSTRRVLMRSEVQNPKRDLKSGMFAKFIISTGTTQPTAAVPLDSVIREGDGAMVVWVANGYDAFERRVIETGVAQDGYWQVLRGVKPGDRVVAEGGLFLSNAGAAD